MLPTTPPPDELPTLYRTILALAAELERIDDRSEAARVVAEASAAYETGWGSAQRRHLQRLETHARHRLDTRLHPPRHRLHLP